MFKQMMTKASLKNESNIVLSLDLPYTQKHKELLSCSLKTLEATSQFICAVKLNRQLVLPLGLFNGASTIVSRAHDLGLPVIMDAKINDIGNTNRVIAEYYYEAGFDAVIASPFVGWKEGLEPVFEVARKMSRGVILLVYMSHKSARQGYGQTVQVSAERFVPQYRVFAERALKWNADGVVVGATYPEKIREVHTILKTKVPIYSPGVGAQGGEVRAAVKAGADYLIVGRAIVASEDPIKEAQGIKTEAWQRLRH